MKKEQRNKLIVYSLMTGVLIYILGKITGFKPIQVFVAISLLPLVIAVFLLGFGTAFIELTGFLSGFRAKTIPIMIIIFVIAVVIMLIGQDTEYSCLSYVEGTTC